MHPRRSSVQPNVDHKPTGPIKSRQLWQERNGCALRDPRQPRLVLATSKLSGVTPLGKQEALSDGKRENCWCGRTRRPRREPRGKPITFGQSMIATVSQEEWLGARAAGENKSLSQGTHDPLLEATQKTKLHRRLSPVGVSGPSNVSNRRRSPSGHSPAILSGPCSSPSALQPVSSATRPAES